MAFRSTGVVGRLKRRRSFCPLTVEKSTRGNKAGILLSWWLPLMFVVLLGSTLKSWLFKGVTNIKIFLSSRQHWCAIYSLRNQRQDVSLKTFFRLHFFLQFNGANISNTLEWHHNSMSWKTEMRGGNEYMWIIKCRGNELTVFFLYKMYSSNIDTLIAQILIWTWHTVKMTMTIDVRVAAVWHCLTQPSAIEVFSFCTRCLLHASFHHYWSCWCSLLQQSSPLWSDSSCLSISSMVAWRALPRSRLL